MARNLFHQFEEAWSEHLLDLATRRIEKLQALARDSSGASKPSQQTPPLPFPRPEFPLLAWLLDVPVFFKVFTCVESDANSGVVSFLKNTVYFFEKSWISSSVKSAATPSPRFTRRTMTTVQR